MSKELGCLCAQCLEDNRAGAQFYFGGQHREHTQQALHNDREGRRCANCRGKAATSDPINVSLLQGSAVHYTGEQGIISCCLLKLRLGTLSTGPDKPEIARPEIPWDDNPSYEGPTVPFTWPD